jgi:hypothetical protein
MRKKIYLLMLLFFPFTMAMAQTRVISGKVTGENGEPLTGATVAVKVLLRPLL